MRFIILASFDGSPAVPVGSFLFFNAMVQNIELLAAQRENPHNSEDIPEKFEFCILPKDDYILCNEQTPIRIWDYEAGWNTATGKKPAFSGDCIG